MKMYVYGVKEMESRTDLALESYESHVKAEINGVTVKTQNNITTVKIINENGARSLRKPVGSYNASCKVFR